MYVEILARVLRAFPDMEIKTARVSSATARGRGKAYSYWGTALYRLRLSRNGVPINCVEVGANSDRRSIRLVVNDLERICKEQSRIPLDTIGRLSEDDARGVLESIRSEHWVLA